MTRNGLRLVLNYMVCSNDNTGDIAIGGTVMTMTKEQRLQVERDNAVDDAKNYQEQIEVMHLRRENELRQMNDMGAEIERLRAQVDVARMEERDRWIHDYNQQAVRIKELEGAMVEERAKQLEVDEPCPARTRQEYCNILEGLCDGFPHMWEKCPRKQEKLDAARQQLHMENAGFVTR